jgi:hypothetical protein
VVWGDKFRRSIPVNRQVGCREAGVRGRRLALHCWFRKFSRPDIRLGSRQPPTVADSLRPEATSQLAEMVHPNRPFISASEGQQVLISMAATSATIG